MKFCVHFGKELLDEAVLCPGCGCSTGERAGAVNVDNRGLLTRLSERVKINAVIWLVIGCLQIIGGIFLNWFLLIVGVLNIISSIKDMQYSKTVLENPVGIVATFEPLTGPIITLVYNLVIGGVIGVVGSIYYFTAIRTLVMENKDYFNSFNAPI